MKSTLGMEMSSALADQMLTTKDEMIRECYEQREEILKSFVAKYGFEPDKVMQIQDGLKWYVVRLDNERNEKVWRNVIEDRINREFSKWSWWQRFCIWMAKI
jgi:hypothetical protein